MIPLLSPAAFVPFSIGFASAEFPCQVATMPGALIAFYQIGFRRRGFRRRDFRRRRMRQVAVLVFATVFSAGSLVALVLAGAVSL